MAQAELPGVPPAPDDAVPAAGRGPRARRSGATVSADALEAALLEALDRPAVRDRLARLVQQALADAVDHAAQQRGAGAAGPGVAGAGGQARVLVVGLPPEQGRTLAAQVPGGVELRLARPGDGHERLRALARGCTAVVVDEAVAAELDEFLSTLSLPTLHHEGSTRRLAQRLAELGEQEAPGAG